MDPDEDYGAAVFRSLDGEPGPSTVDITRAVAAGEHRHRLVRLTGAAGAVAAAVAIAAVGWTVVRAGGDDTPLMPGAAPASASDPGVGKLVCAPRQLPTPPGDGPKGIVSGADPTGRYIVGRTYPGGKPSTVIWKDGQPKRAQMQGEDPTLRDITSAGVAVGSSFVAADETAAWYYADGRYTRLAGNNAAANAINEAHTVAGKVDGKPVIWPARGEQPKPLAVPGTEWSGEATGIDEDGTVVGMVEKDHMRVAALWKPDGSFQKLSLPDAHGVSAIEYTAVAIRDGWVSGWAAYDIGKMRYIHAPLWNMRTGMVENPNDGLVDSVNKLGWRVGYDTLFVGDGGSVSLPPPPGFEKEQVHAYTVTDAGTMVAGQVNDTRSGEPVPVVWTCKQ